MFGHCISILSSLRILFFLVPFLLSFLSLFLISHLIFSSFSLLLWSFSLPFWSNHSFGQKEEISSPFPQTSCVTINFPSLFLIFLFPFYDIINHMASCEPWDSFPTHANCEPFFFVPSVTLLWCHVASLNLVMCHPTPHASKNVKSRSPRNPTW